MDSSGPPDESGENIGVDSGVLVYVDVLGLPPFGMIGVFIGDA